MEHEVSLQSFAYSRDFMFEGNGMYCMPDEGPIIPIDSFIIDDAKLADDLIAPKCSAARIIHAVMTANPEPMTDKEIQLAEAQFVNSEIKKAIKERHGAYAGAHGFSYCVGLSAALVSSRLRPKNYCFAEKRFLGCQNPDGMSELEIVRKSFKPLKHDREFDVSSMTHQDLFLVLAYMHNQFHRGPKILIPNILI